VWLRTTTWRHGLVLLPCLMRLHDRLCWHGLMWLHSLMWLRALLWLRYCRRR
jgi:hypothetical protein